MVHQAVQLLRLDLWSLMEGILLIDFGGGGGSVQLEVLVEVREVDFINNFLIVCCVPECIFSVVRLQHVQL